MVDAAKAARRPLARDVLVRRHEDTSVVRDADGTRGILLLNYCIRSLPRVPERYAVKGKRARLTDTGFVRSAHRAQADPVPALFCVWAGCGRSM